MRLWKRLAHWWPMGIFLLADGILFWRFFVLGEIPMPADSVIGVYYPWLEQDWGYPTGVPVKNPLMTDIPSLLYPWRLQAIEYWKSGLLPLWDPDSFMGMSLIGNFQAGVFNPFNVIFWLTNSLAVGWGWQVVIQPFLAMVGMYWLARKWGVSKWGGVVSGLGYGLAVPVLVWVEYNVHGFTMAMFPWWIGLIHLGLVRGWRWWLGLSWMVCLVILFGYPQFLYYYGLFGGGYAAIWLWLEKKDWRDMGLKLLILGGLMGVGLGLSGMQLLPGLDVLGKSIRSVEGSAPTEGMLYWPWEYVVTLLAPDFFGNPATYNFWGEGYYESFVGYASLVLVLLALKRWVKLEFRNVRCILLSFLLLTGLLAWETPVSRLLQQVAPGMHGAISSRVLFMYAFSVAGLAGIGLSGWEMELGKQTRKHWWRELWKAVWRREAGLLVVFGGLVGFTFWKYWFDAERDTANWYVAFRNVMWPGLILGVGWLGLVVARWSGKKWVLWLLALLIVADMGRFGKKYLPFDPVEDVFPVTESLGYLQDQQGNEGPFRLAIERGALLPANMWSPYDLQSISGYNILVPQKNIEYLNYLNYKNTEAGYVRFVDVNDLNSRLLDVANVGYGMGLKMHEGVADEEGELRGIWSEGDWQTVYEEGAVSVLRNKGVRGRVYAASLLAAVATDEEGLALLDTGFEGVTVKEGMNSQVGNCELAVQESTGQSYVIESSCEEKGFLVITEASDGNWHAKVNGQDAEIHEANMLFMGIELPAGEAVVEVWYRPGVFWWGLGLSGFSLAVWGFIYRSNQIRNWIGWRWRKG